MPVAISLQSLHTFDLSSTQPKYVSNFKELVRSYLVELLTTLLAVLELHSPVRSVNPVPREIKSQYDSHLSMLESKGLFSSRKLIIVSTAKEFLVLMTIAVSGCL